jgi:dipeptidyl aminopeptidase/acylaminoacyl peptidase
VAVIGVAVAALVGGAAVAASRSGDGPVTTDCTQVAVNRNDPSGTQGLAEVVLVPPNGEARLVTGDWVATEPSLSPDGREVVVVRAGGDYESSGPESTSLWVIGTDGGGGERRLTDGPLDDQPAWSPDGSQVAYTEFDGRSARVLVLPADGGEPRLVAEDPATPFTAPAWSPDGRRLAVIGHLDGEAHGAGLTLWTVEADGTGLREQVSVGGARSLDWHPDGTSLLVSGDGGVHLVDIAAGEARQVDVTAPLAAWSNDGDEVFFIADDGDEPGSQWRLAAGHIEGDSLVRDRFVGRNVDHYIYPDFGIDAGRCAPGG